MGTQVGSVKPLANKVLLEIPKRPEKTAGGLVLPQNLTPQNEDLLETTVISVGLVKTQKGQRIEGELKPGDRVLVRAFDIVGPTADYKHLEVAGKRAALVNVAAVAAVLEG